MPFNLHSHHRSASSSSPQNNDAHFPPLGAGLLQTAQNLASFGAPLGSIAALSSRTTAGSDRQYSSGGTTSNSNPGGQAASQSTHTMQQSNLSTAAAPISGAINQYETPRRNRHPDELHLSSNAANMPSQRVPVSPRDYTSAGPRISLEQATPETVQYQNAGQQLPGSLRPGPTSINTAPAVPTVGQSVAQEQYSTPSRTSALGLTHNYTRSSPAGFENQGYTAFTPTTPSGGEQGHFASSTSQKYTPQNSQRTVSNTPLGLADIRPRADSGLSDGVPGANPYSYDGVNAVPTNSNYLAPWAIYAFDWCKWPAQNHDAGKVAVGSYLEDGHNFVRSLDFF